jgi:hypothetical protein
MLPVVQIAGGGGGLARAARCYLRRPAKRWPPPTPTPPVVLVANAARQGRASARRTHRPPQSFRHRPSLITHRKSLTGVVVGRALCELRLELRLEPLPRRLLLRLRHDARVHAAAPPQLPGKLLLLVHLRRYQPPPPPPPLPISANVARAEVS